MIRLKNLIGRTTVMSAITILIFSATVVSINPYTKLKVDGLSSAASQPQTLNTPTADNKTIRTNLNTPVEINLTAKPPLTVNNIPMAVNGSSNYGNNLVDPFGIREIYPTAVGGEQWWWAEISGYLKLNSQGGDIRGHSGALIGGHFTLYARGGKHTGFGASQGGCEGTS